MNPNWTNLYQGVERGVWLRGNLHLHLGEGMTFEEAFSRYEKLGYDFLCISDHRKITRRRHKSIMLIPGFEWNSNKGEHTNICSLDRETLETCVKERNQTRLLRFLAKRPALVILNHPNWLEPAHYSREALMECQPATGIEIYNGLVEDATGTALATDKWDYLLARGRRLFGFAADDAHKTHGIGRGWIWALAQERTPKAVFSAIRQGRFYASTGARFNNISRKGTKIHISSPDAQEIWAVGPLSRRLAKVHGNKMIFDFDEHPMTYARFTAFGKGAAMAWTQPFFRNPPTPPGHISPFVTTWWLSRLLPKSAAGRIPSLTDPLDWKIAKAMVHPEGFINVSARHGSKNGIACLANRFEATKDGPCIIALGHDGGAQLFLDGKRLINEPRRVNPAAADRSRVLTNLTRGKHEISITLDTDHGLGQGIFLRFIKPDSCQAPMNFPKCLTR